MELVRFIFQDFWHWLGAVILISIISSPFRDHSEPKEKEVVEDDKL